MAEYLTQVANGKGNEFAALQVHELPPNLVDRLFALGAISVLNEGTLLATHDTIDAIYVIISGCLKFVTHFDDGRELISSIMPPGCVLGLCSLDGSANAYDVIAKGRTELLVIPRAVFLKLALEDNILQMHVINVLCARARSATATVMDYAVSPRRRLARRLLRVAAAFGCKDQGQVVIGIKFSQEEWAAMLGVARQTVNREFANLRLAGLIDVIHGKVVLKDVEGMRNVAHDDKFVPAGRAFSRQATSRKITCTS